MLSGRSEGCYTGATGDHSSSGICRRQTWGAAGRWRAPGRGCCVGDVVVAAEVNEFQANSKAEVAGEGHEMRHSVMSNLAGLRFAQGFDEHPDNCR